MRKWLTPGQWWTAAIVLAIAVPTFVWGGRQVLISRLLSAPSPPPIAAPAAPKPGAAPPVQPPPTASLTGLLAPPATPSSLSLEVPPLVSAPPRVVALVHHSGAPLGRDDAAIAGVFLHQAAFPVTTVSADGPAASVCRQVGATGRIAVAGLGLDPQLRDCLASHDVTVLSFDEAGTSAAARGRSALISTRRGDTPSLGDLGRWGVRASGLNGRVGVVVDPARSATVMPGVAALRAAGVPVVSVVSPNESAAASVALSRDVQSFRAAHVATVVFATSVAVQQRWVLASGALGASFRYVVSDVDDGVVNERYPPTFDGALAYTTVRVPWYARAHGATTQQAACDATWDENVTPATTLPNEQLDVYAWCQHVQMLSSAFIASMLTGQSVVDELATLPFPSPLTSDLRALGAGDYGPAQDAVLVWRASCACWKEQAAFANRA